MLSFLHQVLICGTVVLLQLRQFWNIIQSKLVNKSLYISSIKYMRIRLFELQDDDKEAKKLRSEQVLLGDWKDIEQILYYQSFLYIPNVIYSELISRHHDNLLTNHFGIKKTWDLIARKYYWPMWRQDIEAYIKSCNVYLTSKVICHKPYRDLQSLPIPIHRWKNLSMDFITGLLISTNWKNDSYKLILVIVDRLIKMVHYILVKVTINIPDLAEVIIDVIMHYHRVSESIMTDQGLLFISKFWTLLCYFLGIKKKLSTNFYPQTNGQTERQNSIIEAYLRTFVN